jgi:hypothetical protein
MWVPYDWRGSHRLCVEGFAERYWADGFANCAVYSGLLVEMGMSLNRALLIRIKLVEWLPRN